MERKGNAKWRLTCAVGKVCRGFTLLLITVGALTGCGGGVAPKMEWGAAGFLGFPWPNDVRRSADGQLDVEGFPGTGNPLLKAIIAKGIPYLDGFGTNSGVMFQFTGLLDPRSLPSASASLLDRSPVMLVNLSPESPRYLERVPLRSDFDPLTTLYQPGHVLTLLPVPGFALEPNTLYGTVVFSGVLDIAGEPVQRAALLSALERGARPPDMPQSVWAPLQHQWRQIADYVTAHTEWSQDEVAAFTVYRTTDPTRYAFPVAAAVAAIPDQVVMDSVQISHSTLMCGYYNHLPLEARVDLPVWQQGVHPYSLGGGMIQIDERDGMARQQGVESTLMSINIGCSGGATPKVPMIFANGTGGSYNSATEFSGGFYDGREFFDVALAVAPHQSSQRAAPVLADFAEFLSQFDVHVDSSDLEGVTFYNLLNPAANIGNHLQSAADQLYLRRVAVLLPEILEQNGITAQPLNFDFTQFSVRSDVAVLGGHSQGASIVPLAMAMDPTFNAGFLSGAASHAYFQAVHRGSIRRVISVALAGIVENEVDYYHPLMQILQTLHGPADSVNYVPYMQTDNLLQVAAYDDQCIPREAAGALGLAFTRAGLMRPAAWTTHHFSFFDPDNVLGITEEEMTAFPVTEPNLERGGAGEVGGIGLFLQVDGGHHWSMAAETGRGFLDRATGRIPDAPIVAPRNGGLAYGCDERYEPGYNP